MGDGMTAPVACIIIALTLPASAKTIKNDRGGVIEHRLAEIAALP